MDKQSQKIKIEIIFKVGFGSPRNVTEADTIDGHRLIITSPTLKKKSLNALQCWNRLYQAFKKMGITNDKIKPEKVSNKSY